MTSTGQLPEPWKSTAATLFNPYLNINQTSNSTRQHKSIRTRIVSPTRHSRAPPESLVGTGNAKSTHSEPITKLKSKPFPSPNAAEEVSIYVQQMIHNQFCGRSGTPSDMRYDHHKATDTIHTPHNSRLALIKTNSPSARQQSRVSESALDEFFNTADEQMSRMALTMPGRESSFSEIYSHYGGSPRQKSNAGAPLTLADVCHIASNVGDKMSQSKEKVGQEAIRGYRLPSARLTYEPYEHHPMDPPLVLGQQPVNDHIHLNDILHDDNFCSEPMIEVVGGDPIDDKSSRASRTRLKSTTPNTNKINEFKDWRGKISQPNLPDVRNRMRRDHSATVISPQRPCTAASNFSKNVHDASAANDPRKEQKTDIDEPSSWIENTPSAPVNSALKNPSSLKQRQRTYPLNVRIAESINKKDTEQDSNGTDVPGLSTTSEINDKGVKNVEIIPRSLSDPMISTSDAPYTMYTQDSSEQMVQKRNYRLIPSSSQQVYRTVPDKIEHSNPNPQLSELTLSQLELLEEYDPSVSARIGAPFIPVQMLARPRDAYQSSKRSIEQIQKDYPKINGQPVFQGRPSRSTHNLIDIAQTLQLTKSKRIRVERQTTFEKPDDEKLIEEAMKIKPFENPNRLAISIYPSPDQRSLVKHTNSTRTSSKFQPSQLDHVSSSSHYYERQTIHSDRLKDEDRLEYNLSVLNIRTQQEVDQMRRRDKPTQKRLTFPTSIVTHGSSVSSHCSKVKQRGRPVSSVFITQDPDEFNTANMIYRQAKSDVDIKRVFKGFISQNLQRKLSAEQRKQREEQQKAAIKIQRAYREHLQRRSIIENHRPSTGQQREQDRDHRRILSAKRAHFVEQRLIDQTRIREENVQYENMVKDTGPSLQIFANFNQIDAQFSKSTMNRAATCIQRWWRGFILRHRWNYLKTEVNKNGLTWFEFSARYRGVIERIQKIRQSEYRQFIFNLNQARDFLVFEKKLTIIFNALSFNEKLEPYELENFFESCDLSVTPGEIEEALQAVLQNYPPQKNESLTKTMVFDVVYYIFPPEATGLDTSRKSTWVRPIIDGEDHTAIDGTSFLEPMDLSVLHKFLGQQ